MNYYVYLNKYNYALAKDQNNEKSEISTIMTFSLFKILNSERM